MLGARNFIRLDADDRTAFMAEVQDILEDDDAYGSDIQLLTVAANPKNGDIQGRFRDAFNNRVFDFSIDDQGIGYKPSANLDGISDGDELEARVDAWSAGYVGDSDIRIDAKKPSSKPRKKPKCGGSSYSCGRSCIGLTKTCRVTASGKKLKGGLTPSSGAQSSEPEYDPKYSGSNISKERLNKLRDMAIAQSKKGASGSDLEAMQSTAYEIQQARKKTTERAKYLHKRGKGYS